MSNAPQVTARPPHHHLCGFTGLIQEGQGETKWQSRIRVDEERCGIFSKRRLIDRRNEDRELDNHLKEV